jgi:hypothetical protein
MENESPIARLASPDSQTRTRAAEQLFAQGRELIEPILAQWRREAELGSLLYFPKPRITTGVAVNTDSFERIRAANGNAALANVPTDQDAREFELHFGANVRLDILTTKDAAGSGAIARFLQKFGEGVQQVELETKDCDAATNRVRSAFGVEPLYSATRPGADGTHVNFFLVSRPDGRKVLVELVEAAARK